MATDTWKIRALDHHGELYLCRADLLDHLQTMADRMPNDEDRDLAQNLVDWLRQGTRNGGREHVLGNCWCGDVHSQPLTWPPEQFDGHE
jgi:hypothetical protein